MPPPRSTMPLEDFAPLKSWSVVTLYPRFLADRSFLTPCFEWFLETGFTRWSRSQVPRSIKAPSFQDAHGSWFYQAPRNTGCIGLLEVAATWRVGALVVWRTRSQADRSALPTRKVDAEELSDCRFQGALQDRSLDADAPSSP